VTLSIQFGSRNYLVTGWTLFTLAALGGLYIFVFVPESPQFLEERGEKEDYEEARGTLTYVARFNGVSTVNGLPYNRFKFISEHKKFAVEEEQALVKDASEGDKESVLDQSRIEDDRRYAEGNYIKNVVLLSIMWTVASFSTYLLIYLSKYIAGSIFLSYYFEGIAGLIGYIIAIPLYWNCKTRISFIICFSLTLAGAIPIILFE